MNVRGERTVRVVRGGLTVEVAFRLRLQGEKNLFT